MVCRGGAEEARQAQYSRYFARVRRHVASSADVLVEFQPGHVPGLDFVSIEREFSGLLQGRRVDMVTPKFLNARIRDAVLTSAEPLHDAA
jgi:hypothetical protein